MRRLVFGILSGLVMLGCTDAPPEAAVAPEGSALMATTDTMVRDQIERTRENSPEALPQEDPAPPAAEDRPAPPRPAPVAPPPPTNTAPAAASPVARPPASSNYAPSHALWNDLLQRHVSSNGRVSYIGFQKDRAKLDEYLRLLAKDAPDSKWTADERLAYWINAYNAFTIQLVLDHWPVKSIRDIDQPWDQKFITLEEKPYSLNQIEHEIIRPNFAEPRIHFALVCAAVSCPPLANQAYTPQNLERLLEQRTRSFINDEQFNVTQEAVVRVSPLFDWYAKDFGDPKKFLNRYLADDIPPQKELHFLEYDWELND